MEKVKVKDLVQGQKAIVVGKVSKKPGKTTNGDPYISFRVTDNSGTTFGNVWNNIPIYPVVNELEESDWVEAEVVCTKTGQFINVDYQSVKKIEKETEKVVNIESIKKELRQEISEMQDDHLKALVTNVFKRPDVKEPFFKAPASMMSGYSFQGGLASHVVRSIRIAKAVAKVFNEWEQNVDQFQTKLNEDLLKTACILHDVGKVRAFSQKGNKVVKTPEGELFEDSYITLKIVLEELEKVNLPEAQRLLLEHVLGSSKGKQGYGALFLPRSREAVAFHFIDALDVQMSNFEFLDRNAGASDMFVQLFQKTMFLGNYDE